MISIDDNVPMPNECIGRPKIYPFEELEVGQSFFFPERVVLNYANTKYKPKHFKIRKEGEGTRVWRDR